MVPPRDQRRRSETRKTPWRGCFREEDLAGPPLMALAGPSLFSEVSVESWRFLKLVKLVLHPRPRVTDCCRASSVTRTGGAPAASERQRQAVRSEEHCRLNPYRMPTVAGRRWDGFAIGVRDQRDQWHRAKYRYASEAQGTINTREMGCCLSGNIPLRGVFAPIHALFVALVGA